VRGPKPVAAMKEFGLTPTYRAPEPNTWREVLQTIDQQVNVANQTVAVQEYGLPNASLVAGLEARGATVKSLKIYSYEFPEETAPLEANLRLIAAGEIDVVLFTSAHQVINVLRMAERLGIAAELRREMGRLAIASIGPTTSECLHDCDLAVDLEPEHPRMGQLVQAAAERSAGVLLRKRRVPLLAVEKST